MVPMATGWKLPFNLALILHILVVASALILPKYLNKKPILPDFQTVDLVNIAEPQAKSTPPKPAAAKPAQKKPPVAARQTKVIEPKKAVSIAPPVAQETPEVPIKAISIKPLKRKLKKKLPPDTRALEQKKARGAKLKKLQAIERKRQQLLQEARRQKALAKAEAAAANDAVNALKRMLQADAAASSEKSNRSRPSSRSNRTSSSNSVLEAQYQAAIFNKLTQYWAPPEISKWKTDLTTVVVIQIAKNGRILSHKFETRSGDRVFDQFVSRTIQDANPLPPIPGALKKQQYEIGLRFSPGGFSKLP